jgi:hypothetical protein
VSASHLARTLTSALIFQNKLYPLAVLGLLPHNHFHTVLTRLSNFGAHGNAADKELSRIALQNCLAQEVESGNMEYEYSWNFEH